MLPLTFATPADYDLIAASDTVSIIGLTSFRPDVPLTLRVTPHPSRNTAPFDLVLNHTFNEEQIEWFKAGSALNFMKSKMA